MYEDPAEVLEESKEEFAEAAKKPGIHLTNPTTPLLFSLPGGLDEFPHVYMEATLRSDVTVATFEWWWTKSQDYLPQLEVQTEQYKPGALNYSVDNFKTRNEAIPDKYFQLNIGQRHLIKFFFDVKDRYLVVKIDGMHALFELIERDAKRYDQLRITGAFDIHVFRALHEQPLPMPLTVPLTPEELLKGGRLQIKGKNTRKAQQLSVFAAAIYSPTLFRNCL
ncbi:uncharacterized protein LOC121045649 [Ixodes scapularis]|uniref:uncharacterized protein LOC121045649 n=1 Tax=Ixodes scapularis TaxID=6945 RepID=UPI001C391DBD|nr:uncharacterized protein LOC121045649 [Ixodes scapularis]